jgi:hypothetical protein
MCWMVGRLIALNHITRPMPEPTRPRLGPGKTPAGLRAGTGRGYDWSIRPAKAGNRTPFAPTKP